MKKFLLSLFLFAASGGYVAYEYLGGSASAVAIQTPSQPTTVIATNVPASTPAPPQTPAPVQTTPTPTPAPVQPKGQYRDGTYTGSTADAYYGYVQVRATVQGGKLTDVTFLQYPNDRSTSVYINSQAMPLLKSEAIQAQSANVSGVSGASDTSMAFRQSLGDALALAKNS